MSSNSMTDYVEAFRANLPNGVTYDTTIDRYFFNGRRFLNEWSLLFYIGYLNRLGSESIYAIQGFEPGLVLDFQQEYYRTGGSDTTFESAMTTTRAGNATMTDSDGLLKWAPHNLVAYSEQFDNAAWVKVGSPVISNNAIAPDGTLTADTVSFTSAGARFYELYSGSVKAGEKYTIACWVKSDTSTTFPLSINGRTQVPNNLPSVNQTISTEYTKISREVTVVSDDSGLFVMCGLVAGGDASVVADYDIWGFHFYRSDLGGMVNNPDRGDSYVPTTTAARFLSRRGHHAWNGSAWVNEGMLVEPTAATNLVTYSEDFANVSWSVSNSTVLSSTETAPDGAQSAYEFRSDNATALTFLKRSFTLTSGASYTESFYVKNNGADFVQIIIGGAYSSDATANFDIINGVVGSVYGGATAKIEGVGDGWYRCSCTFTADATASGDSGIALINSSTSLRAANYVGDGVSGVLVYGAQLEQGSVPTSYIPTAGATATRAADTAPTVSFANLEYPTPKVTEVTLAEDFSAYADQAAAEAAGYVFTSCVFDATNNEVDFSGVTANLSISAVDGLTAGDVYRVTVDVANFVSGSMSFQDNFATIGAINSGGTFSFITTNVGSTRFATANLVASITDVRVEKIEPLAVCFQLSGLMTYADTNVGNDVGFFSWASGGSYILARLNTVSTFTGRPQVTQRDGVTEDLVQGATNAYSPGINVPFNLASRHGSTFINGAADGVIFVEDTTPTQLPLLASSDLVLANTGGPMILKLFRMWAVDLTDAGIAEASA